MKTLDFNTAFDKSIEYFESIDEEKKLRLQEASELNQATHPADIKSALALIQRDIRRLGNTITPASKVAAATLHREIISAFLEWLNRENGKINVSKFIRFIEEQGGLTRLHVGAKKPRRITGGAIRWVLRTKLGIIGVVGRPSEGKR